MKAISLEIYINAPKDCMKMREKYVTVAGNGSQTVTANCNVKNIFFVTSA